MASSKSRPIGLCQLCRQVRPLCDSHLLPRGLYATFRAASDPRHVVLTANRVRRTTRQIHAYLLCDGCEERFNSLGERWVLRNCLNASGKFALRDALRAATPTFKLEEHIAYPGHTPGVDVDQLVYFAASVLWRGAVYDWSGLYGFGGRPYLGPYEEQLREFLLGLDAFPQNGIMIVYVADEDSPYAGATSPTGGKTKHNYYQYSFQIPGIWFSLLLGQLVPNDAQLMCAVRSGERVVFLTKQVGEFFERAALSLRSKLPVGELLK